MAANEVTGRISDVTAAPSATPVAAPTSRAPAGIRGASYSQGRAMLSPQPGAAAAGLCAPSRAVPVPPVVPVATIADPVARNQAINQSYHQFDTAMSAYFGPHVTISNWFTYGQHASREAGTQIRNLDEGLSILRDALSALSSLTMGGEDAAAALQQVPSAAVAIRKVVRLVQQPGMVSQAIQLTLGRAGVSVSELSQVVEEYNAATTTDWYDLIPGHVALEQARLGWHVLTVAGRLLGGVPAVIESLVRIRNNMVRGNRQIYENVAPAAQQFLSAANSAPNGNPGRMAFEGDPNGFLSRAFSLYGRMRVISDQIACEADETAAGRLRASLVPVAQEANLLVGFQEQLVILQPIFDTMQPELAAIAGSMTLTDPNGVHRLLPNGGNWGNFYARMGLDPSRGPEDPRTITAGNLPPLLPSSDPRSRGTIAEYFNSNTTNERIHNAPRGIGRL